VSMGSIEGNSNGHGLAFIKAVEYLRKRYHITHIRISGYNSRSNGIVERSHFDIWEALYKAADGDKRDGHK
jgi:hypothetical protein